MTIRVLWLDDEFDSDALKSTFIRMEKHFTLIKCYTRDEFLTKIESETWDAIVLDVLDSNGRDSGFNSAVRRILSEYKDKPWFVFSGQETVVKKESDIQMMLEEQDCRREYADNIYVKGQDNDKLIHDIRQAVEEKPAWQLKKKYSKVLSAFDGTLSGKEQLFDILLMLHGYKDLDHQTYYTQLRLILEWLFRDANRRGLLHDKCIGTDKKVNLTESSLFMAGKPTKYLGVSCEKEHFPKIVAENVRNILNITGGASHTAEQDQSERVNLQAYWKQVDTPYLLYSLTFMLCDILIWYKAYADINNDREHNMKLWKDIEQTEDQLTGKITNFSHTGLAFLKPEGSSDINENCSISPELLYQCLGLDQSKLFTVEYEITQILNKRTGVYEDKRVASRIVRMFD